MPPSQLNGMVIQVEKGFVNTKPKYDLVIKRLHLYYMKLVTFGTDDNSDLIVQFQVFVQPYSQSPLIIYQMETVQVPIIDQNTYVYLYTEIQIPKPY